MKKREVAEFQYLGSWAWTLCAVIFLLAGCAAPFDKRQFVGKETVEMKVASTINGFRRTALVHIPEGYTLNKKYPLVIVLHGAFSTAEEMEKETGFSEFADREKFIVLYPNGMGIMGMLQHWNAGHCCGKAAKDQLDDVSFLEESIDRVSSVLPIDRSRVYMAGFSNGGMMAYRFAAEKSHALAALAVLGGSIGGRAGPGEDIWLPPSPVKPVPTMIVHGTADGAVPFAGGRSPQKGGVREYMSVRESLDFWLDSNDCKDIYVGERLYSGVVDIQRWQDCLMGSSVELYTLRGWGHRWPGTLFTKKSKDFDSFDIVPEIWRFFEKYSN